ncbi:hypothetical protein K488DRAFT_25940, partial [Vararia minispora EC-137]
MATTTAPNQRASLLSGLRTGGVRSSSVNVPHTAAPGATFNIPRFASASYSSHIVGEEEEMDQLADMVSHKMHFNAPPRMQQLPLTAAVDGSHNRFAQQQAMRGGTSLAANSVMSNVHLQAQAQQQQALQMQMMHLEMLRLQARAPSLSLFHYSSILPALQAQQYQAELIAQAQLQQQQSRGFHPPATAGPIATSFGAAQLRRPSQAEMLRHQLGLAHDAADQQVPMTAALNGKFGGRLQIPDDEFPGSRYQPSQQTPMTPTHTSIISGGASLGHASAAPSKSDAAVSWRRASTNNSVLRRSPPPLTPDVKITPPPIDTDAPPAPRSFLSPQTATTATPGRARPSPLRFSPAAQTPVVVAVDESTDGEDGSCSEASSGKSSPATPQSGADFAPPLSPREEATKKLYEGLGLGRPADGAKLAPYVPAPPALVQVFRVVRQPRGPPSGTDELGPRNFATRIRKQAIGGLGTLLDARERRE